MGSGVNPTLKTNLGVNAQALRHMEHIVRNAITVDLLGMNVQVPKPESYVLHKMIINSDRKPEKQVKDRHSIARLLPYIDFKMFGALYTELTKKEKARVRTLLETHSEEIFEEINLDKKIEIIKAITENVPELNNSLQVTK